MHTDTTWPFVTLPDFEARGSVARKTSKSLIVGFLPLVSDDDRPQWEEYAQGNQDWIDGAWDDSDSTFTNQIPQEIYAHLTVEDRRVLAEQECSADSQRLLATSVATAEPTGSGPYSPVWQLSPPPLRNDTSIINYNLFEKPVFQKGVDFINHTRKAVFLDVCHQSKWFGSGAPNAGDDQQTVVVQPVFADFSEDAPIVAHFVAVV